MRIGTNCGLIISLYSAKIVLARSTFLFHFLVFIRNVYRCVLSTFMKVIKMRWLFGGRYTCVISFGVALVSMRCIYLFSIHCFLLKIKCKKKWRQIPIWDDSDVQGMLFLTGKAGITVTNHITKQFFAGFRPFFLFRRSCFPTESIKQVFFQNMYHRW